MGYTLDSSYLKSKDFGSTNNASKWQQSLRNCYLNSFYKTFAANNLMATGCGFHGGFGVYANHTLKKET